MNDFYPGLPPTIKFTGKDFNVGSQVWTSIQDDNGLMYFATQSHLIQYDGEHWNLITKNYFQCLLTNEQGRIYAGGYNAFGYLEVSKNGKMEYISLLNKLPDETGFTIVRNIHRVGSSLYFVAHNKIMIYDEDSDDVSIIDSGALLFPSYNINGRVLVMVDQKGICEISGNELQLIENGNFWADKNVASIVAHKDGDFMTLSSISGAFLYTEGKVSDVMAFDSPYFRENDLFYTKKLTNGNYGFCFLTGGFVLTNDQFRPLLVMDRKTGANNQVHHVYEDDRGDLWLSTDDGLVYVNIKSQINHIGQQLGLDGAAYFSLIKDNELFVSTYAGVYYKTVSKYIDLQSPDSRFFKKVENSEVGAVRLLEAKNTLFSAHNRAKGEIRDHRFYPLLTNNNTYNASIGYVPEGNVIVTNNEEGQRLEIFKLDRGRWSHKRSIIDKRLPLGLMAWTVYDPGSKSFWAVTTFNDIYRFRLNSDFTQIDELKIIDENYGLAKGETKVFILDDRISFCTPTGLYYYDNELDSIKKDNRFGDYFDNLGLYSLEKESDLSYWYQSNDLQTMGHLMLDEDGTIKEDETAMYATIQPGSLTYYYGRLSDDLIVSGALNGVYIVRSKKEQENHSFVNQPLIRTVKMIATDSIIHEGYYNNKEGDVSKKQLVVPELANTSNSLRFKYAAPFFKGCSEVIYRTKLEGFDEKWSEWTIKTEQDFTNIPYGSYAFSVQARNIFGKTSDITSYRFVINAPYYYTWWAFAGYITLLTLLIVLVVKINARRLKLRNLELEATIKERVAEIENQKGIIAQSLEEKEALLKEIHHRVKNNLQIIASLLFLQSGKFENEDYKRVLEEGQGRVRSMALIHQKLYENDDLKSIPFEEYLNELVGEIRATFGMHNIDLNISADRIFFDVDTAVPLGLIVNELATNAFKYAFKKGSAGSFSITLTKVGQDYVLNVRDDGMGLPDDIDIKKTKSLGLRLVRMLSQQLEGDFQFERINGTKFSLKFTA